HLSDDVLTILGPLWAGLENFVRWAVESRTKHRARLTVILDTTGGVAEVVERIVRGLRKNYNEVRFLIPDRAMSAGTILGMSRDSIIMDYHSCLGPIDPQVEREGKLVPALSYLYQYEELINKAGGGKLSTAEAILLQKLDLAELHQFALA